MADSTRTRTDRTVKMIRPNEPDMINKLAGVMRAYLDASDYYVKDRCFNLSLECLRWAALIHLQIRSHPQYFINLSLSEARRTMQTRTNYEDASIIAAAYGLDLHSEWIATLYAAVVVSGNYDFLEMFLGDRPAPPSIWVDIAARFKNDPQRLQYTPNMKKFLQYQEDKFLVHQIASDIGFNDLIMANLPRELYDDWLRRMRNSDTYE